MATRFRQLIGGAVTLLATAACLIPADAGAAGSLPTINLALSGTHGISVSGSTVSGAVSVVATFSGTAPSGPGNSPAFGIVRLDPGVSIQQAAGAVQSHRGDLNALTPYAALLVSQTAPATLQTGLTPGNYVALNITGHGQPAFAPFTVRQSSSPAALPAAAATETAFEFGFHGPTVLHDGTVVRAQNGGWLVHMIDLIGVRNAAAARAEIALLRAGKDRKARKLATGFASLLGPSSPGALQQGVLHAKPGYYIEACFMNTQDGREHTQLGMLRLIRVAK
jgi:hypothetical protein